MYANMQTDWAESNLLFAVLLIIDIANVTDKKLIFQESKNKCGLIITIIMKIANLSLGLRMKGVKSHAQYRIANRYDDLK